MKKSLHLIPKRSRWDTYSDTEERDARKVVIMQKIKPWLNDINLLFFEEKEGDPPENKNEDKGEKPGENEGEGETNDPENDPEALRKALRTERAERKRLERDSKRREDAENDKKLKEQGEVTLLTKKLEEQKTINTRLGSLFYNNAIKSAIEREAKLLNFIDTDDAISGVDRQLIDAEQDPDDPSVISIDDASVKRAVKALADRKKHLIRSGTDDGQPSGSSFGGTKSKDKPATDQEKLLARYANL